MALRDHLIVVVSLDIHDTARSLRLSLLLWAYDLVYMFGIFLTPYISLDLSMVLCELEDS